MKIARFMVLMLTGMNMAPSGNENEFWASTADHREQTVNNDIDIIWTTWTGNPINTFTQPGIYFVCRSWKNLRILQIGLKLDFTLCFSNSLLIVSRRLFYYYACSMLKKCCLAQVLSYWILYVLGINTISYFNIK